MTHAPVTWEIEESDYGDELWFGGTGAGLISVNGWSNGGCKQSAKDWEALQAEARLIAAAPAMFASLKSMVDMMEDGDEPGEGSEWYLKARAALNKATGEQP